MCHAHGLRQGDPLSSKLFVIAMDVLNHFFKWIQEQGFLSPTPGLGSFRLSLYADDLVLFVTPEQRDLEVIKVALHIFGLASGLFSNLEKSVATLMHCSAEDMERVQSVLAFGVEQFPCRYVLGDPPLCIQAKARRHAAAHRQGGCAENGAHLCNAVCCPRAHDDRGLPVPLGS